MATLALSELVPNGSLPGPAGTAADATNIVSAAGAAEEVMLRAVVTTATTDVTVKAGDNPPALSAGQADLTVPCPVGTTFLGPFTSARFSQSNGAINVDVETAANVTLTAFRLPRTA